MQRFTLNKNFYRWSVADGLTLANNTQQTDGGYQDPPELLHSIWNMKNPGVFLLLDFHPFSTIPKYTINQEIALQTERYRQTLVFSECKVRSARRIEKHLLQILNWSFRTGILSRKSFDPQLKKLVHSK